MAQPGSGHNLCPATRHPPATTPPPPLTVAWSGGSGPIFRGNLTRRLLPGSGFLFTRSTRRTKPRRMSCCPSQRARSSPSRSLLVGAAAGGEEDGNRVGTWPKEGTRTESCGRAAAAATAAAAQQRWSAAGLGARPAGLARMPLPSAAPRRTCRRRRALVWVRLHPAHKVLGRQAEEARAGGAASA